MKKTLKIVGIVLGSIIALILLLMLGVMFIAPGYIRDYVNENSEELAGQKVTVGDVSLNLFTLTVDADDIVVYMPKPDEKEFLTIDHLNIDLEWLPLFSMEVDAKVNVAIKQGGRLNGHVGYEIEEEDFDVKFDLNHFNLNVVLPYLQQSMTATDFQGLLDAKMHIAGNVEDIFAMKVDGQTCVSKFLLADNSGEPCVQADSLSLATSEVNLLKNRYGFSYIFLKNPDIRINLNKDTIDNISSMLIDAPIDQQADSLAADSTELLTEEPFDLYIDQMAVSRGKFQFTDNTLAYEPFVYQVDSISFESQSFTLSGINDLAISCMPGSGNGSIKVNYHGCFDDIRNMKVLLDVKNVALKDFSPYVVQMLGYPMTGGTLSFNSDTKVNAGDLDSYNHLIINNPVVEDKRKDVKPEIKGVPLKTGIYIITDKNGVCDMELPITGNIDEPKFSVKKIIFRTLGKLMVKVAAAPFGGGSGASADSTAVALPAAPKVSVPAAPKDTVKQAPVASVDSVPQVVPVAPADSLPQSENIQLSDSTTIAQ